MPNGCRTTEQQQLHPEESGLMEMNHPLPDDWMRQVRIRSHLSEAAKVRGWLVVGSFGGGVPMSDESRLVMRVCYRHHLLRAREVARGLSDEESRMLSETCDLLSAAHHRTGVWARVGVGGASVDVRQMEMRL